MFRRLLCRSSPSIINNIVQNTPQRGYDEFGMNDTIPNENMVKKEKKKRQAGMADLLEGEGDWMKFNLGRRRGKELKYTDIEMNIISIEEGLKCASWTTSKPFIPKITYGKVIKVYDGDTITIACRIYNGYSSVEPPELYRFPVRLNGIDSPEMKSPHENEKKLAHVSQEALSNLIFGKIVTLQNVSMEKYGRVLADVYLGSLNVNQWMLEGGYAVKYDGGTKHRPNEWDE